MENQGGPEEGECLGNGRVYPEPGMDSAVLILPFIKTDVTSMYN